jgi:hypothetical protein
MKLIHIKEKIKEKIKEYNKRAYEKRKINI